MAAKSFDEISVQDVTETAHLNRATFYDHYTDKYALLEAMVGGGFHQLLHERKITFSHASPEALSDLVIAACDYLTQVHGSPACGHQSAFQPLMDAAVTNAIRRLLLQGLPTNSETLLPASIIATAASGALYGAVKEWASSPTRPAARKIAQPLVDLVRPMLGRAFDGHQLSLKS